LTEAPGRIDVALAVAARSGKLLVRRRGARSHLAGRFEFPGGRIETGETPVDAARRELREESGLEARELEPLVIVVHDYPDRALRIHVYLAREPAGEPSAEPDAAAWEWKTLAELRELDMPDANREILEALGPRLASP
jgi:8-oxo-dGTP diphosphatase